VALSARPLPRLSVSYRSAEARTAAQALAGCRLPAAPPPAAVAGHSLALTYAAYALHALCTASLCNTPSGSPQGISSMSRSLSTCLLSLYCLRLAACHSQLLPCLSPNKLLLAYPVPPLERRRRRQGGRTGRQAGRTTYRPPAHLHPTCLPHHAHLPHCTYPMPLPHPRLPTTPTTEENKEAGLDV